MDQFIKPIIIFLEELATKIPLELFTVIGTITEEVIAPIPSPLVMTLTGTIAKAQQFPLTYILFLALLGSIGKTFGSWIIYLISDKAEDIILGKFGKFFGVTHKEVEMIGKRFDGTWKDEVTIGALRAIPVMSTALVSIACGIVKVNMKAYLIGTFFGNIVRNLFFLYIGYTGLAASEELTNGLESSATVVKIIVVLVLGAILGYGYFKRFKNEKKSDNL